MAERIILIRHGDTGQGYQGRFIGSTDVPLSAEGRRQSSRLAVPLLKQAPEKCFCSPALRTRETAGAATGGRTVPLELAPNISEIDFGSWEGKTFEEINASAPGEVVRWAECAPDFSFPRGESMRGFMERVADAGRRIAADPAKTIAAFTHAGVIRALICHYLALDIRSYLYFDVRPASLTMLTVHDGRGVLTGLNDCCHLEDGDHG